MKYTFLLLTASIFLFSCNKENKIVVDPAFVDSLLKNHQPSETEKVTLGNLSFWKKKMDSLPDNFVNGPQYAAALTSSFMIDGDINSLLLADSLIKESNKAHQQKEDGIFLRLASLSLLQHRFKEAREYINQAMLIGGNQYGTVMMQFDADFETGNYKNAALILKSIKPANTYAYYFRRSKYEHYAGSLDSSIAYMLKAAEKAKDNKYLLKAALSNAADLNLHKGNIEEAYALYKKCILNDASDYHSIMGIGWIALVHDKDDSLAERIFESVHQHIKSPDPLYKLQKVAEARSNNLLQVKYASAFAAICADTAKYGDMCNKYLIELYTGILNKPEEALKLAEREINNRPTPQTFSWYTFALLKNNEKEKAYKFYKQYVSGKPLEASELFYTAVLLQSMNKNYDAQRFFEAAYKNKYDLSPLQLKQTEAALKE